MYTQVSSAPLPHKIKRIEEHATVNQTIDTSLFNLDPVLQGVLELVLSYRVQVNSLCQV